MGKILDFDEFEKLVNCVQKEMSPINVFSSDTCLYWRNDRNEVQRSSWLDWDNIDFTNNKIKVDKAWRNDKKRFWAHKK